MSDITVKLVLLGEQGVGKTSIIVQYVDKMFNSHISPTIGASFFSFKVHIHDHSVKMQVWDTAGQERFQAMAPMYYRNASTALIVYDITNASSFKMANIWVREIKRNVEGPIILILIGNKSDLHEKRVISRDNACSYAAEIGAMYFETSAFTGDGVEKMFVAIAEKLIEFSIQKPQNFSDSSPGMRLEDSMHASQQSTWWCC